MAVTSGVKMNRTHANFPDDEQQKRLQARQEHDKATGKRADHPPFTKKGPTSLGKPGADRKTKRG